MWRLLPVLVLVAVSLSGSERTQRSHIHYYVQLIRATDSSQPPQPGIRPVGPQLAATFNGPLRWSHYWEICRREADVPLGGKAMLDLANQRAVEIDLTRRGERTIIALQNGKSLGTTAAPMSKVFTITGGNRDRHTAWFIVVRRDKPGV